MDAKECRCLLEAEKGKEIDGTLESSKEMKPYCDLDFSPGKSISDSCPLEL